MIHLLKINQSLYDFSYYQWLLIQYWNYSINRVLDLYTTPPPIPPSKLEWLPLELKEGPPATEDPPTPIPEMESLPLLSLVSLQDIKIFCRVFWSKVFLNIF
ncbi:hypothetical protein [Cryptosporidium hominis TU502]|uniref:hypothetical protein n=1 Tax=Cryptosporidium hominis (strain TU502) TaxID=353151 RepID=UPI00004532B2|nr:hypothetical protein [Cryptosporidium hominis TU502]